MAKIETEAVAREVAKRVKDSVVKDTAIIVPEKLDVRREGFDKLYDATTKANSALPGMVDELLSMFHHGETIEVWDDELEAWTTRVRPLKPSEKRRIFETLAKFSLTDKRLEQAFGLLREQANQHGGSVSFTQFNLNVLEERMKPHGALDDRLKELVRGQRDEDTDEGKGEGAT